MARKELIAGHSASDPHPREHLALLDTRGWTTMQRWHKGIIGLTNPRDEASFGPTGAGCSPRQPSPAVKGRRAAR